MTTHRLALPPDFGSMIPPNIRISPFTYPDLDLQCQDVDEKDAGQRLQEHLGRPYALTSSGRHALKLVLTDAGLNADDTVTIFTTTGNSYVSGCVTRTIGQLCRWSMKIETSTKLILVIHEWGIPFPRMEELLTTGIPIAEDCAYAFASSREGEQMGRKGAYSFFSLPKFFPINFGGVVCGVRQPVEMLWEARRAVFSVIGSELPQLAAICNARISAWRYLESAFSEIGCGPTLQFESGTVPGVFMFTPHDDVAPEEIKRAYKLHGIEASVFYPWHAVFIPCHQKLTPGAMKYMVSVYEQARRQGRKESN
jgi:hypothetical protein